MKPRKINPKGTHKVWWKRIACIFFLKKESTKKNDVLGSYVLNILKLPRDSRNNNGKDNDLVTETAMQGCRILCGGQRAWSWTKYLYSRKNSQIYLNAEAKGGTGIRFVRLLRKTKVRGTIQWSYGIYLNIPYLSYIMLVLWECAIDVKSGPLSQQ